jgi:hydrogenase expression/formation protein HypC
MCIGIPMQIVSVAQGRAWCEGRGRRVELDTLRVGDLPSGTWLLAFNGTAVRVLDASEAGQTNAALDALEAALAGVEDLDAYFGDLVERERERTVKEVTKT